MIGKSKAKRLIRTAGGDCQFAQLLGIADQPKVQQRVNNWKRRGIPAAVVLAHYEVIQSLLEKSETPESCQ